MKLHIYNIMHMKYPSMKCVVYEMSYLWNVLSMNCPSMKWIWHPDFTCCKYLQVQISPAEYLQV